AVAILATAPSAFKTFLPIVIPILLIVMKSTLDFWYGEEKSLGLQWLSFIGTPVIALLIGLGVALFLPAKWDKHFVSHTGVMGRAIKDAANILLITGAGGIFGKVLQLSGIADELAPMVSGLEIGIWVPFLVAALIKTAQGSSTVALITTASILAPLADSLGFVAPIEKALLVVAIGAGSLVVSHANDSAFWVVTQMTGMKVGTGYRVYSLGTLIVGFFAACLLFLASLFI
ncbi:MAG: GntP family permease, partial [Bacteroidota bacterium]